MKWRGIRSGWMLRLRINLKNQMEKLWVMEFIEKGRSEIKGIRTRPYRSFTISVE
jgi:hypothetical protein